MTKRLFLLSMAFFCFFVMSCDISTLAWFDLSSDSIGKNTFSLQTISPGSGSFSFLVLADEHFLRSDSGVWYAEQTFFDWLDLYQKNSAGNEAYLDFIVSLGDGTEDASEEEFAYYSNFMSKIKSHGLSLFAVKGNHDIRPYRNYVSYWNTYIKQPLFQAFSFKGVSFYLLDTSSRTFGRTQFKLLEQALETDCQKKVFLTHMPLYGKPGLYYYCLPDTQERENILRLMHQYSVGLYLAGHHHNGDLVTKFSDCMAECVLGAFHGRTFWEETTLPRWYVCSYDVTSSVVTITKYEVQKDSLQVIVSTLGTFTLD